MSFLEAVSHDGTLETTFGSSQEAPSGFEPLYEALQASA
jgi:hypothetical protein